MGFGGLKRDRRKRIAGFLDFVPAPGMRLHSTEGSVKKVSQQVVCGNNIVEYPGARLSTNPERISSSGG